MYAVSQMARKELARLLQRIDDCCESMEGFQSNHVKLMLYFDEAHMLAERKVPDDPDGMDLYDVLCSCFNIFVTSPIFVIYLSVNFSIRRLIPQPVEPISSSCRFHLDANALQAPVTEIPWDCSSTFPILPGKLKLEDVCKVEFMAQFGRPM
jgi:hypothetical protein